MGRRSLSILLLVGSTLLCVLSLEVVLRLVGFNPFGDLLTGQELILRESDNPDMIYELTPNSAGFAWGTEVTVNAHGFRDREYKTEKSRGVYRIAVLGDSVTFGNFLPVEATYPKRLEQAFHRRGLPVEVLNFGVGGYDTLQEVALLKDLGLKFAPDEVIVGYSMNDVGVMSTNLAYIRRARTYGAPVYNLRVLQFLRSRLDVIETKLRPPYSEAKDLRDLEDLKNTLDLASDTFLRERVRRIEEHLASGEPYHGVLSWYTSPEKLAKLRAGFARLAAVSHHHGVPVSVMIIPFIEVHGAAYGAAYDIVRREARCSGFEVIEVLDRFLEHDPTNLKINPGDNIHPNETGHDLMAEKLLEQYLERTNGRLLGNLRSAGS